MKNYYFTKDIKDFENFKIRNSKLNNKKNSNKIYIIGDSITKGFGLAYQDTFFGVAENMFEQNMRFYKSTQCHRKKSCYMKMQFFPLFYAYM